MTITTITGRPDPLSPARLITAADRDGYAASPAFWRMIADAEPDDERRAKWLANAAASEARLGRGDDDGR